MTQHPKTSSLWVRMTDCSTWTRQPLSTTYPLNLPSRLWSKFVLERDPWCQSRPCKRNELTSADKLRRFQLAYAKAQIKTACSCSLQNFYIGGSCWFDGIGCHPGENKRWRSTLASNFTYLAMRHPAIYAPRAVRDAFKFRSGSWFRSHASIFKIQSHEGAACHNTTQRQPECIRHPYW